jgi:hypothetical protein
VRRRSGMKAARAGNKREHQNDVRDGIGNQVR